jgi:uncharacterized membrane protein
MNLKSKNLPVFLLRIGIAFSLFYAGISIFLNPNSWIGFVPEVIRNIAGNNALYAHAFFDIFLGVWLLTNKKIFYASALTAINIFLITIFNLGALDIVFRDITIFFSAIALTVLTKKR